MQESLETRWPLFGLYVGRQYTAGNVRLSQSPNQRQSWLALQKTEVFCGVCCMQSTEFSGFVVMLVTLRNTSLEEMHDHADVQELRIACHLAEEEIEGGVSQRVSPLAQVPPSSLCHNSQQFLKSLHNAQKVISGGRCHPKKC